MKLFWGIAADGSVMITDNEHYIKAGCAKSFAPFPAGKEGLYDHKQYSILFLFFFLGDKILKERLMFGAGCMYHTERGLASFEHPMKKMKAMPRVDSEGVMCGANFKVDVYSKVQSMPRVGSEANWAI